MSDITNVKPTSRKVYFIRVDENEYQKVAELALLEERSINKMANLLLKSAIAEKGL